LAAKSTGARERFATTALQLIEDEGGSSSVNLRQISRRMGCAHTNVYNYYASYQDLLWEAYRRALRTYAEFLVHDLDASLAPHEYLRRTLVNLAAFPEQHPGLCRFIGSDPVPPEGFPEDILAAVLRMKRWLASVFDAASCLDAEEAQAATDIVLAYIDGETLNLINGRVLPNEDIRHRVVTNAMRLFGLLAADDRSGPRGRQRRSPMSPAPETIFGAG
jgi:AcrR family transcriptional regulator